MTDYREELHDPLFRNLVLNPGGEASSLGSGYLASNGYIRIVDVLPGDLLPPSGASVTEYEVSANTSNPYVVSPFGPMEAVHRSAFKIPAGKTLSFGISLAADRPAWIQVQASWLREQWVDGAPAGTTEFSVTSLGYVSQLSDEAWDEIILAVPGTSIPDGVTHWRPRIAVFSADPRIAPTAPVVGTKIWLDQVFVSDSGEPIDAVWPADGDSIGWEWEGDQFFSSSRVTAEVEVSPEDPPDFESPGYDELEDPFIPEDEELTPEEPIPDEPPAPEAPVPGDPTLDDPGFRSVNDRPAYVEAQDIIGWKPSRRNIHLHEDIQLESMVFNRMDEHGVVWIVNDIEGWWTTPEPDVPDVSRGWFDGSYETRGRYNARTFTVSGHFMPRHPGDVAMARDRLIRALNLVHKGGWFMTHEDPEGKTRTKGSKVWLAGQPLISTTGLNGKTEFSIALRAPNPVKQSIKAGLPPGYESLTLLTSSSQYPERPLPRKYPWKYPEAVFGNTVVQAVNEGNAVVWPTLKLAGPTNGAVRVYNADTEQTFRIVRKLYPGEVLEIDCFTKQVTLNGQGNHRFYLDIDVDWLMLQPGPNKIYFYEEIMGANRAELEIKWRSGWIG